MQQTVTTEAQQICQILRTGLPEKWDGKKCILELKEADYQWRQMEWIGWYFEYKAIRLLYAVFGSRPGPSFGATRFDFKINYVWDFKAHPMKPSKEQWVIVNDKEAIDRCISNFGGVGVVIAEGDVEYDDNAESFKLWHDSLKGKRSEYENERVRRGAPSRKRKKAFCLTTLDALWFDKGTLSTGIKDDWIASFQEGMRNADGSSRRAKYMINLSEVAQEAKVASL